MQDGTNKITMHKSSNENLHNSPTLRSSETALDQYISRLDKKCLIEVHVEEER